MYKYFFGSGSSNQNNESSYDFLPDSYIFTGNNRRYVIEGMSIPPNFSDSEEPKQKIHYVSFNCDGSRLGVGYDGGYKFYAIDNLENVGEIKDKPKPEDTRSRDSVPPRRVSIIERLNNSSLIVVVSMNQTRKLWVYNASNNSEICGFTYTSAIMAVRINRHCVVVCEEDTINIHSIQDMKLRHKISDTPNKNAIVDLSNIEHASYLTFPGSSAIGNVIVFDTDALTTTIEFNAHAGPLAALRFSADAKKLATASEKGTVIRVFSVPKGERLYEFSRGVKRCVTISSMAFSADSRFLCLSSNTETLHIFSLTKPEKPEEQTGQDDAQQEGLGSWMSYISQQASAYLPTQMNELMLREKSIATARLPIIDPNTVVAMRRIDNVDYLLAASTEGYLFCFEVNPDNAECTLVRQFRIGPHEAQKQANETDSVVSLHRSKADKSPGTVKTPTDNSIDKPFVPIQVNMNKDVSKSSKPSSSTASSASTSPQDLDPKIAVSSSGSSGSKPTPPPIPPAPKKRSDASAAPPMPSIAKGSGTQVTASKTNPFDIDYEDDGNDSSQKPKVSSGVKTPKIKASGVSSTLGGGKSSTKSDDKTKDKESRQGEPFTDFTDMDEFPPLNML